jgi:hypothetical protein
MRTQETLSLSGRLKLPGCRSTHPSLSHPGRLVRLLRPIILILFSTVYRLGYQLTMRYSIASQLIGNYPSGLLAM